MDEGCLAVIALAVSVLSVVVAMWSVIYAKRSANASVVSADAATRSANLAEVVEKGRHHGWRIEARSNDAATVYTLRNVGTVDALDVHLGGQYYKIGFRRADDDDNTPVHIAAGQARLFSTKTAYARKGGEVHITWTPALPHAIPMTWTEVPPLASPAPPRDRG